MVVHTKYDSVPITAVTSGLPSLLPFRNERMTAQQIKSVLDRFLGLAVVNEDSQWMYSVAFLILAIVTVITLITVITARRKIAICAGIIKEATTVFTTMPLLMTFPIGSIVVQMGVCAWFIAQMMLINTTQSQSIDLALNLLPDPGSGIVPAAPSIDPIENVRDLVTSPWYQNGCFVITIYGFFVLIQWVQVRTTATA